jgi:hypothetical protein
MSDFNVAIFSDKDFTRKQLITTDDPWGMNGEKCNGGSTLSSFLFDNQIREFTEKAGSFRGYNGPCVALGVHFDFDGASAQEDVKNFLTRMYDDKASVSPETDCRVWFSGSKGFHVLMGLGRGRIGPSDRTPTLVKQIAEKVAARYITWDSSVYDRTRGIRVNNSRHQKSGLFKIELHPNELWTHSLDEIKQIAFFPRMLNNEETKIKIAQANKRFANAR